MDEGVPAPVLSAALFGRFASRGEAIREADDLGADEAFLDVGMDGSGGLLCGRAFLDEPRSVFRAAHGQVTDISALGQNPDKKLVKSRDFSRSRRDDWLR